MMIRNQDTLYLIIVFFFLFIPFLFGCENQPEDPTAVRPYYEIVNVTPEMATVRMHLLGESNGNLYDLKKAGATLDTGDGRTWNVHDFHSQAWKTFGVSDFIIEYWRPIEAATIDDPFTACIFRYPMINKAWSTAHVGFTLTAAHYALWLVDPSTIQEVFITAKFSGETGGIIPDTYTLTDVDVPLRVPNDPTGTLVATIIQQGYAPSRFGTGFDWIMVFRLRTQMPSANKILEPTDSMFDEVPKL
jgi:hypothetical protein